MPNFKPKANKKIKVDKKSTITLDSKHNEKMKEFNDIKHKIIPDLQKRKKLLRKKLKITTNIEDKLNSYDDKEINKKNILENLFSEKTHKLNSLEIELFELFTLRLLNKEINISFLKVDPSFIGKGVAQYLMLLSCNYALHTHDIQKISLDDDTDNAWNLDKWESPAGTVIESDGYLVVWADEDGSQGDLHANFKLSGSGEYLYLTSPEEWLVDMVDFPASEDDLGYARVPNGTGDFTFQAPTFSANNDEHSTVADLEHVDLLLFPNPANSELNLVFSNTPENASLSLVSTSGQTVISEAITSATTTIDVEKLIPGIYLVVVNTGDEISTKRVLIQ